MWRRETERETELTGEEGRTRVRADAHDSQRQEMERERRTHGEGGQKKYKAKAGRRMEHNRLREEN